MLERKTNRTGAGQKRKNALAMESLESRNLLAGDVVAGGVLGLRSDIDDSGVVDFADFLILSKTFGDEVLPEVNGDINLDGAVDFHDFHVLSGNFGRSADVPTARIQVIHNSPFASAAEVDVYLDDGLLGPLNDFAFRNATPFIDVPAGVEMKIGVAASDSTNGDDPLFSKTVILEAGKIYVAAADGDPAVSEGLTAFDVFVSDQGQETVGTVGNAEVLVFHGSPDAPRVDVIARDVGTLVDDISYPQFSSGYVSVPPSEYTLDITPGDDNETVVASFNTDLSGAADVPLVVAASGFLSPSTETDPAFGLLAVFPDGSTALLPAAGDEAPEAQIQIIHNSPYASAATVDVYVNDDLFLDNVDFRDATAFDSVPAGVELSIDITAPDAADSSNLVFTKVVTLKEDEVYVAIAAGDPMVEGEPQAFDIFISDQGQTASATDGNVDLLVFHGAPDAPTVDVVGRGVATLVDDLSYSEFSDGAVSVPADNYLVDITPGEDNETVVAAYQADLSAAGGGALVVAASGFLNPSESDPAFGLLAVFPDGTTALLPAAVEEVFNAA